MSPPGTPEVRGERDGAVLVVTIDRPQVENAINTAAAEGIGAAMEQLDTDDALFIGVLTGAGGVSSAGMDLGAFLAGEEPHVPGRGFAGLVEGQSWTAEGAFARQWELYAPIRAPEDAEEGARAVTEKRAPVWRGR